MIITGGAEPIGDIDWNNWTSQLDVHLTSYASLLQLVLPDLRQQPGSAIVAISSTATPMTARSRANEETRNSWIERSALKRLVEPEEIGAVAQFLLSDEASFITGQAIVVDSGVTTPF